MRKFNLAKLCSLAAILITSLLNTAEARDLDEIRQDGVLRHLGVPYANFIATYDGPNGPAPGGLDVDLMRGFAAHLGLEYQYVPATWGTVFGQLTGSNALYVDNKVVRGPEQEIEGDIIANGATILPWRQSVVDFSTPYFPSAVWLVARSDSTLHPIKPTGSIGDDIAEVKRLMDDRTVLAMKQSCLDPDLYQLHQTKAQIILPKKERKLNEMVPAILNQDAESTLLDVPDSLIALEKWPGEIKVIGPVSKPQEMAVAFRKDSPKLRQAFNQYLDHIKADGTYLELVEKHYPTVFYFYQDFFENH